MLGTGTLTFLQQVWKMESGLNCCKPPCCGPLQIKLFLFDIVCSFSDATAPPISFALLVYLYLLFFHHDLIFCNYPSASCYYVTPTWHGSLSNLEEAVSIVATPGFCRNKNEGVGDEHVRIIYTQCSPNGKISYCNIKLFKINWQFKSAFWSVFCILFHLFALPLFPMLALQ